MMAATGPGRAASRPAARALAGPAILIGLLVLAAVLRLSDLATRGTWDADQGHDMLVLRELVRHGSIPLLGPPTSIGDFHHGAWYYFLLAPAAWLGGAGDEPLAVVLAIALAGIAAVGVTWWLGRSIAGPVAGAVAGLAMAVSTAAVDESTFIWNPNLIALSSSIALAGAWHAWTTRSARWWLLAAAGTAITMQCHVLGVVLLPVIVALFVADLRRTARGEARDRLWRAGAGALAIFLLAYLPLIVHELTTGGLELRAAADYFLGGSGGSDVALPIRLGIVGLRVVSWPLVGLITDGFVAAVLATCLIVGIVAWRWRTPDDDERVAVRWLGLGLGWSALALTVAAPSLASVVAGLPNDHYHAFADPMVFVLLGIGAAVVVRAADARRRPVPAVLGAVVLAAILGWNLTHQPPRVHPDGGFPAAAAAAEQVGTALASAGFSRADVVALRSLPVFKSTEAMAYPLVRLGQAVDAATPQGGAPGNAVTSPGVGRTAALVLLCDDLFHEAIGAACGGPAEAAVTPDAGGATWGPLLLRIEAHPGRWVSVYPARP
jgi:4-amino-4-deoxy-L-arabinose transferase-like glycosyltransferase